MEAGWVRAAPAHCSLSRPCGGSGVTVARDSALGRRVCSDFGGGDSHRRRCRRIGFGGIPEVIGDAGIVVPEGNVEQLADAITSLCRDRGGLRGPADRGQERVRLRYTWRRIGEQVKDVYTAWRVGTL